MEIVAIAISLAVGGCVGAFVFWAVNRGRTERQDAAIQAAQGDTARLAESLRVATEKLRFSEECRNAEALKNARHEPVVAKYEAMEKALVEATSRAETLNAEKSVHAATALRVPSLEAIEKRLRDELLDLKTENTRLNSELGAREKHYAEKTAALIAIREEIEKNLEAVTNSSLISSQEAFLKLANETFEKHKAGATAEFDAQQKAVQALVTPLQDNLKAYQEHLAAIEKARNEANGSLSVELKNVVEAQNAVRTETAKLTNALRASPKTRGRWGEHTLKNVLELSGLSAYCDYTEEENFKRDGSSLRPDVVIRLPGNRAIVVDAKTSLTAYLNAVDTVDEAERERFLVAHATQLRSHVRLLADKAYWDGLTVTPDFVVMFVPGENFYSAALERDPNLFEDAVALRVIIVTPATLIALAKAVAFGWRQEKVAENAQKVHALGQELYKRIGTMTDHVTKFGSSLLGTVKHYNNFVGSLERSVLPQARRFRELEVLGTTDEIAAVVPVDEVTRELRKADGQGEGDAPAVLEVLTAAAPAAVTDASR